MNKEEIGKLIDDKKFSKNIRCFGDDKLRDFIKEIYFDGMREGYELAKKGTFNIRISPELHKNAAIYAAEHKMSLNSVVETALAGFMVKA